MSDNLLLGYVLSGSFDMKGSPVKILGKFKGYLRKLFDEVREDIISSPGPYRISAGLVGHNY
ncbi:MAG: hypothetical protein Q8N99_03365 [Nanoarchaeota archaeon]|nr:hypothetical protein [Nanoarchaeota archaeon]